MNEYLTTFNVVLGGGVLTVLAAIYHFAKLSNKLDTVDKKQDKLEQALEKTIQRFEHSLEKLSQEMAPST